MSTNHTPNYGLCQWEAEDKVLRTDFNADNAKIDGAIKAVDRRVDGKADSAALDSLGQTVSSLSGTVASQGNRLGAISLLGNCQVYATTYTGDGKTSKSLSFPGYPMFVFIQLMDRTGHITFIRDARCAAGDYGNNLARPTWSARGLSWVMDENRTATMNDNGSTYAVLALLDMSK